MREEMIFLKAKTENLTEISAKRVKAASIGGGRGMRRRRPRGIETGYCKQTGAAYNRRSGGVTVRDKAGEGKWWRHRAWLKWRQSGVVAKARSAKTGEAYRTIKWRRSINK